MAIKITGLQEFSDQYKIKNFVYSDLHLDVSYGGMYSEEIKERIKKNDVVIDYDESAIRNSIRNLFNTKPGQRFLFPNYGLDLYQFVFEPVSPHIGQQIGDKIVKSIETFEPRVRVQSCKVNCLYEENQYDVTIIVEFPVFNTVFSINSQLDTRNQSFIFVETSRNR